MRAGILGSYILLLTLLFTSLATVVQATEYSEANKDVQAADILNHIENGDDVNLTNCHIFGELNLSKIKLETVPNPCFNILLSRLGDRKYLIDHGVNENLSVIASSIIIKNSTFENNLNFASTQFKNSADFRYATFKDSADFSGATFKNSADFMYATFKDSANFWGATFNNFTYFYRAYFNNSADFTGATFNDIANFWGATFKDSANFLAATFKDSADFSGATFKNSANFGFATFNNTTNFGGAKFNDAAEFIGPTKPDKLLLDEMNFQIFYKYYNGHGRYDDADTVYYNYRQNDMKQNKWSSFGYWWNFLSWITCGFGIKPLYTIIFGIATIFLFSGIYANPISLKRNQYKEIPFNLFPDVY